MALTKAQIAAQNRKAKQKRVAFTEGQKWIDYINGKYGWLVNIYNTNPEVANIIKNGYVNDEPIEDIKNNIVKSKWNLGLQVGEYDYLKGTSTNDRSYLDKLEMNKTMVRDQAAKSGYSLDDSDLNILSAGFMKAGWDAATLANKIGEKVVAKAKAGGAVGGAAPAATTPTGLQQGTDAASLKALSRSYGLNLSDSSIEGYTQSIISGTITAQQIKDQFRNQAKSLYPALAAQLDTGTVDDATESYRSIAAQTLGIDQTAINFSDATKFGKLLTYQDPKSGESRLMNATEWTQYLRGLPDWAKTSQAKEQYSGIINTVTKLFGKVG
jgi:hypothetical protein